jgi:hypothetical protein
MVAVWIPAMVGQGGGSGPDVNEPLVAEEDIGGAGGNLPRDGSKISIERCWMRGSTTFLQFIPIFLQNSKLASFYPDLSWTGAPDG